ncbi:MAG TPA: cystathionine gamma-synthase [Polyangiales bacterium]|nr:cystathionine gamma-synthase [Polyangiales bacterium]
MNKSFELDTLAIHAGQAPDKETGAVMPPIHLSSTFAQEGPGRHRGFEYSRTDNPTRRMLEHCIAALEDGEHGLAFASGSSASAALLSTLRPGDHVIACDDVYGGTYRLMNAVFAPQGIEFTRVDLTDLTLTAAAVRANTKMLWVETPTNPLLKLIDLPAMAKICERAKIALVVDNTFATPVAQRPLALGAQAVVHSTTKYLNGHSDVVGGAIVTRDGELAKRLRFLQNAVGAVPSPFDCYLVLRGLKTLPLRMRRHTETATALAKYLEAHEAIASVRYPGLASHPQHALGQRQMALAGGMISCELRGGFEAARAMLESTRLFVCAESLGGVESLIEHPASMTHASLPKEARAALGIGEGLVRLSVGLEAEADLRDDIAHALLAGR